MYLQHPLYYSSGWVHSPCYPGPGGDAVTTPNPADANRLSATQHGCTWDRTHQRSGGSVPPFPIHQSPW